MSYPSPYNGFRSEKALLMFWSSVALMGILSVVLLYYLDRESRRLEATMMLTVLAQLHEAIAIKTAEVKLSEPKQGLKNFVNNNPMNWLKQPPMNYSGIIGVEGKVPSLQGARWYFDEVTSTLLYKAAEESDLVGSDMERGIARFRVELVYIDKNRSGRFEEAEDKATGLELSPVTPFRWQNLNRP